jgi:predicted AlkP superfamily phosphohydrolase/phosphomutase
MSIIAEQDKAMIINLEEYSTPEVKARLTLYHFFKGKDDEVYRKALKKSWIPVLDYMGVMKSITYGEHALCLVDDTYNSISKDLVNELAEMFKKERYMDITRKLIELFNDGTDLENAIDPSDTQKEYLRDYYLREYANGKEFTEAEFENFYEDFMRKIHRDDRDTIDEYEEE